MNDLRADLPGRLMTLMMLVAVLILGALAVTVAARFLDTAPPGPYRVACVQTSLAVTGNAETVVPVMDTGPVAWAQIAADGGSIRIRSKTGVEAVYTPVQNSVCYVSNGRVLVQLEPLP